MMKDREEELQAEADFLAEELYDSDFCDLAPDIQDGLLIMATLNLADRESGRAERLEDR